MVVGDTDVASLTQCRVPPPLATRLVGTQPLITFITLGAEIERLRGS